MGIIFSLSFLCLITAVPISAVVGVTVTAKEKRKEFINGIAWLLPEEIPSGPDKENLQRVRTFELLYEHHRFRSPNAVASVTLQDMIDRRLRATASNFRETCIRQEEQRKKINNIKRGDVKLPAETIADLFHALKCLDEQVASWKKNFWDFHKLAAQQGFRVWPEYEAYLMLAD